MEHKPKYTWKVKNKMLLIGIPIFALLVYQLAIKKTVAARNMYYLQQEGLESKQSTIYEIGQLKKQIGNLSRETEDVHDQNFFEPEFMVALAHNTKVIARNLSEATVVVENDRNIIYNTYYFSGSFTQLLKLLDQTEKKTDINVLNVRFYKERNHHTRETELIMKLETATID